MGDAESDCDSSPLYYGVVDNKSLENRNGTLVIKRSVSSDQQRETNSAQTGNLNTCGGNKQPKNQNKNGSLSSKQRQPHYPIQRAMSEQGHNRVNTNRFFPAEATSNQNFKNELETKLQVQLRMSNGQMSGQNRKKAVSVSSAPTSPITISPLEDDVTTNDKSKEGKKSKGKKFWRWKRPWSIFMKNSSSKCEKGPSVKRSQTFSGGVKTKKNNVGGKLPQNLLYQLEHQCSFELSQDIIELRHEGSYFSITQEEAEAKLAKYELGTYLLRPNKSCTDFCLSYVVCDDHIEHSDIRRTRENGREQFELIGKSTNLYNSLMEIVNMGRNSGFKVQFSSGKRLTFFLRHPPCDNALISNANDFSHFALPS